MSTHSNPPPYDDATASRERKCETGQAVKGCRQAKRDRSLTLRFRRPVVAQGDPAVMHWPLQRSKPELQAAVAQRRFARVSVIVLSDKGGSRSP